MSRPPGRRLEGLPARLNVWGNAIRCCSVDNDPVRSSHRPSNVAPDWTPHRARARELELGKWEKRRCLTRRRVDESDISTLPLCPRVLVPLGYLYLSSLASPNSRIPREVSRPLVSTRRMSWMLMHPHPLRPRPPGRRLEGPPARLNVWGNATRCSYFIALVVLGDNEILSKNEIFVVECCLINQIPTR